MATSPLLYKYTPGQASAQELEATFVGRATLLDQLLERARQWVAGAAPEHTLLVGARGMGKTHLLRLLHHRLQGAGSPHLRVVLFPEESYTVGSADELILQVWARLRDSAGQAAPSPPAVGAAWVLDRLRAAGEREGARFLVLLDGFDLLLDQFREADERRLHEFLTTEPHVCLMATAAVAPAAVAPAAVAEHDRPLFRLLRVERLRPLDPAQAEELLHRRAELAGDQAVLAHWAEMAPRIRAVAELAGGNPRLLLMLYQSLQAGELPSVTRAFRALLDELTPFYKHVVESRAPQQRKLLGLAAFHVRGVSPTELAAESSLPERQVSALLGPLVKDGLLRRVRRPGSRASAYPFAEPLLRLWLQMRSSPEGERYVACIVEFYRVWYAGAEEEFRQAFAVQWQEAARRAGEADSSLSEALLGLRYLAQAAPSWAAAREAAGRLIGLATEQVRSREGHEVVLAGLERALELEPDDAIALFNKGVALGHLGRPEETVAIYDDVVRRFGERLEAASAEQVAKALFNKGVALGQLGRLDEAVGAFDEVMQRFGERPEVALLEQVASALVNKGAALGQLGRLDEVAGVYDDVVRRFGERLEAAFAEQVAKALFNKGVALGQMGRLDEAVGAFDEVVQRFGERPEVALLEQVATSLVNKGMALGRLGRLEEAVAVSDVVAARFGESPEAFLALHAAWALVVKGLALDGMHRPEEALAAFERAMARPPGPWAEFAAHSLAGLAAAVAVRDDRGLARRAIYALAQAVSHTPAAIRRGELMLASARAIFGAGHLELSREALERLQPLSEDAALLEPFRQAIAYLAGGRDPYFLDALNPDVRRAVELIAGEFGAGSPDRAAPSL